MSFGYEFFPFHSQSIIFNASHRKLAIDIIKLATRFRQAGTHFVLGGDQGFNFRFALVEQGNLRFRPLRCKDHLVIFRAALRKVA
ncbi:MAG: hypothetical protein EA420_03800 [Candidatus Competibacteraceae bacterium]|nr:MAG: hypothetical protein EA420_03800 [Candidatus Competibacteraceae bacterium]